MFDKSFTLGKVAGIPIKIHFSFLIILPFLAWAFGSNLQHFAELGEINEGKLSLNAYFLGLILAILLFVSVGLHELTHSLVARKKGMEIDSITLMLMGGVAQMEEISKVPEDEIWMAASGPIFSLSLGVILIIISRFFSAIPDLYFLVFYLGQINIVLGIFNLIPAFPTDGGRIMRAFLARRKTYLEATKIAVNVGKGFAFFFGIIGLITANFLLVFVAFFIFIGASQEYYDSFFKETLSGLKVKDLMTADVSTVSGDLNLTQLLDKMFAERHSGYPVVDNGRLRGCVTMEDIKKVSNKEHPTKKVKQIMSTDIKKVNPDDDIYHALKLLSAENIGRLMVVQDNELVGIITRTDIIKGFQLQEIRKKI
ncbi:MAG: CBS domain-containing protein [Halanaerobiales bacterium]